MDIVSKLTDWPYEVECKKHGVSFNYIEPICRTAATEITRLREENKRMRDALEEIAKFPPRKTPCEFNQLMKFAHSALATTGGE